MEISILNGASWGIFIVFLISLIITVLENKTFKIIGCIFLFLSYAFYFAVCYKTGLVSISIIFLIHGIVPIYTFVKLFIKKKED